MGYKRSVRDNTRRMLYAKSGNICAMYGCSNQLIYENKANVSEICHIEAVNEDGARYNENLSDEYVNSYDNLILLCPTCHKLVDNKLNEAVYTVQYLKQMKLFQEQRVREALLEKPTIEPPMFWESYNIVKIIEQYNYQYSEIIDEKCIYNIFDLILVMNPAIRSVIYGITILSGDDDTDEVDVHRLNKMSQLNLYEFAEILMLLSNQNIIEETCFVNPMDGYEDENGDWHFVQNDYLYKTTKGSWWLRKRGKLFVSIYKLFGNKHDLYDFLVNRNIELLRKIEG